MSYESTTENLKNTANELQKKAVQTGDELKDKAKNINQKINDTASDIFEQGKSKFNELESVMCGYSDEAIKAVKEKPLSSILIAAGVGFMLSRLLK